MPINSVFVYADGHVGLPTLPVDTEPTSVSAFQDPPVGMMWGGVQHGQ